MQQENDKQIDKKIDNLVSLFPQCKKYFVRMDFKSPRQRITNNVGSGQIYQYESRNIWIVLSIGPLKKKEM